MKFFKKILTAILLLTSVGSAAFAQNFKASLDSTKILIGNQTLLTVEVMIKEGQKVRFPNLPDTLSPGLEVVSQFAADTSDSNNDFFLIKKRYLITSFDSGNYVVPSIPVLYFNGSKVDTLLTEPLKLRVNTVAVDSTKTPLYGIKGNIKAPYTFAEIAIIVLLVLLLAAIIVAIVMYFRRSKEQPLFSFTKKIVEPAHVIAFRELDELLHRKLWQGGRTKEYYSELSDILRRYMVGRMKINAMEMTSFEILVALKGAGYANKTIYDRLMVMLNTSDLVKFAKYVADPIENDQSAKCIYDFIDDTKEVISTEGSASTEISNLSVSPDEKNRS